MDAFSELFSFAWMREYFSFTKKERIAVIALVAVILGAYFLPYFFKPEPRLPTAKEAAEFKALEQQLANNKDTISLGQPKKRPFPKYEKWQRYERYEYAGKKPAYEKKPPRAKTIIDINDADTAAFIALPGIGAKLAARIIAFRDKLGGFYSIEQIAETYGLPDSTFQKIHSWVTLSTPPRKININTATTDVLKQHPYIRWNLANAIIRFREQHGPFKSLDDLQQVALITPEIYHKILPYLTAPGSE